MKKSLIFAAAMAFFAAALPLGADEAAVKVFMLKYKRVEEAALLIRPHLSPSASVTLTQSLNAMTVTDREENLRTIAKVLASFDDLFFRCVLHQTPNERRDIWLL